MNVKTAGIITFHRSWNYGACLQAWATKKIFEQLGYEAELVDYVNEEEQSSKGIQGISKLGLKRGLTAVIKNMVWKKHCCAARSFDQDNGLYPLTGTGRRLDISALNYDLLVAGSDQIWNPKITGGIDPVFFLAYGEAKKRISLSSSVGSHCFSEFEQESIRELLRYFDAISVRGTHAQQEIQRLTDMTVMQVPDPTMLLERTVWHQTADDGMCPKHPYVLTYFVGKNYGKYRDIIRPFIQKIEKPVYNVQFNTMRFRGAVPVIGATPVDLLGLIRNAEMVITDSFHGSVFSIIFEKPFIVVENKANPKRVREFLKALGLENRIEPDPNNVYDRIDYKTVQEILDQNRRKAINWLREMIESGT